MYGKDRDSVSHAILTDSDGIILSPAGKYADAAIAGRLFQASNQAAVATTAALATTWTGLALVNPAASGKMIIVHEFSWALSVVGPAAGALGLMTSDTTGLVATINPRACKFGAGASVAIVDDGGTIATPVLEKIVSTYGTGAISTWQGAGPQVCYLNGSIVLGPGRSVLTYTFAATTAAFIFSFLWEEIDA